MYVFCTAAKGDCSVINPVFFCLLFDSVYEIKKTEREQNKNKIIPSSPSFLPLRAFNKPAKSFLAAHCSTSILSFFFSDSDSCGCDCGCGCGCGFDCCGCGCGFDC